MVHHLSWFCLNKIIGEWYLSWVIKRIVISDANMIISICLQWSYSLVCSTQVNLKDKRTWWLTWGLAAARTFSNQAIGFKHIIHNGITPMVVEMVSNKISFNQETPTMTIFIYWIMWCLPRELKICYIHLVTTSFSLRWSWIWQKHPNVLWSGHPRPSLGHPDPIPRLLWQPNFQHKFSDLLSRDCSCEDKWWVQMLPSWNIQQGDSHVLLWDCGREGECEL